MKKTALTILILTSLSSGSLLANDSAIQARVEQVKSEFNLNEQQAKRIANILANAGMSKEEKRAARMNKHIQRRVDRMTRKLELSQSQASQLKTILEQQHQQMRALHAQGKADITAILTPEQAAKFAEMRPHKSRGRHGKRWKKHNGDECRTH